ncbi:MAG: hypothetical protein HZA27_00730 [Candidatus Omnitrophica bacterium]|nr:hypothetical protein [Candidatus Omnitrophota bacterium]
MAEQETKTATAEVKPATPQAKPELPKAEEQTNCLACNKPLKKIKRYYRDGKYYCAKKCWRNFINKPR